MTTSSSQTMYQLCDVSTTAPRDLLHPLQRLNISPPSISPSDSPTTTATPSSFPPRPVPIIDDASFMRLSSPPSLLLPAFHQWPVPFCSPTLHNNATSTKLSIRTVPLHVWNWVVFIPLGIQQRDLWHRDSRATSKNLLDTESGTKLSSFEHL